VQVEKVVPGSAAAERGVLPLSFVDAVNGQKLGNATASEVSALLKRAPRPITLTFDASAYDGLAPDEALARAAASQGIEAERVSITPLKKATGCGLQSREGDVVSVDFSARVAGPDGGREFDSSAMRSGRPFAFLLGNGDVVRGFELGCFEMCIGEERMVRTSPA
jgi:FKBP-type peptidyl-prolyl cis-trans isomerase